MVALREVAGMDTFAWAGEPLSPCQRWLSARPPPRRDRSCAFRGRDARRTPPATACRRPGHAPDCRRAWRLLASAEGRGEGKRGRGVSDTDITRMLALARDGEPARLGAVFEALYPELRRLANSRMYGNESTFTPTVLVHELFLRITQGAPLSLADRNHFFAASAKAMRWIMVEHARQRAADK